MDKRKEHHGPPFKTGRKTTEGRPLVKLPGNRLFSSEVSITVTDKRINQGRPTNIPSIFGGLPRTQEESIQRVIKAGGKDPETGRHLRSFATIPQAVRNAQLRSSSIKKRKR